MEKIITVGKNSKAVFTKSLFILLIIALTILGQSTKAQTLYDSYTDGNYTASPIWSGNTSNWTIVTSSDAAAGATSSNTLRLNASAVVATDYLSSQVSTFGTSQEWGFWVGRRAQAFTASNQMYIWLYANESTLNNLTVDGYRLTIGDDTGGDEIRLEYVVDGAVSSTVITSSGSIPNAITDIGFLLRVTRSSAGLWTLYTSTLPTANGNGAIATDIPNSTNAATSQGSATNNTLALSVNGYIGVAALHSSGTNAIATVELDQVYFTPAAAPTVTTTSPPTNLLTTSADLSGNVTSDGGSSITGRGVVYSQTSLNSNPQLAGISTTSVTATGTTGTYTISATPLSVNTQYSYNAYAINAIGTSYGTVNTFYTLANVPSAPTVNNPTVNSLNVAVNVNGNPSSTAFAIQETNSGSYVQANGSLSGTAVWQTATTWGTKTVTPLSSSTSYTFQVKARNGASVETAFGATASGTTSAGSASLCPSSTAIAPTADQTVCQGVSTNNITATISTSGSSGTPTYQYQWYYNSSNSNTIAGATKITGATSNTLTPLSGSSEAGTTRYYFCVGYATDNTCSQTDATQGLASNTVKITVNATPVAPTGSSSQSFCSGNSPTVNSLVTTGSNIKWYDASNNGNQYTSGTALVNGNHYYASQTTNGCESTLRFDVTATVNTTPSAPSGSASQSFCSGATVANLSATGTSIKWYDASSNGNQYTSGTALINGNHYYASQTTNGCESSRLDVTATVSTINYGSVSNTNVNSNTHLVISQVYGGGGNTGATYANDFIEIFNPTANSITISNWKVQYASATGSFADAASLSGTLLSGKYYLITLAAGGGGGTSTLPNADATGTTNMSATAGKVRLIDASSGVIDLFGFGGTADTYEGAPIGSVSGNVNSYQRKSNGCTDTDDNSTDFTNNTTANARNSSTSSVACLSSVSSQTICSGTTPNAMTTTGASGDSFTYQWYYQNGSVSAPTGSSTSGWTSLGTTDGANTNTYTSTTGATATRTYACFVSATTCTTSNWATGSRTVVVNSLPNPTFTATPSSSICAGTDVTYTTQSGQSNYVWTFSGTLSTDYSITSGGTSSLNTVTLKWLTAGNKTVTVNYSSNNCSGASAASNTSAVTTPSTAATSVSSSAVAVCEGSSITLTQSGGTLGTGAVWKWYSDNAYSILIGTGAGATGSLTYTPTATNSYYVRAESATAGSCAANVGDNTKSVSVTFNAKPVATASNTGAYCVGETINLSSGPINQASYAWSGPNSYSTTAPTQTHTQDFSVLTSTVTTFTNNATISGWYISGASGGVAASATYVGVDDGTSGTGGMRSYGSSSSDANRTLGSLNTATSVASGLNGLFYGVKITNTTGQSVSGISVSYLGKQWKDQSASIDKLTVHYQTNATDLVAGTWTALSSLTYNSPNSVGSSQSLSTSFSLATPLANGGTIWIRWSDFDVANSDDGLAIDDVSITLYGVGSQNPTISNATTNMSGGYTVTVTSSAGCSSTAATSVTVNPLPTVSASSTIICEGQSATLTASGASTYSWSSGGNASSETVTTSITTTYTVTGTSSVGCTSTANSVVTVNPLPTVTASSGAICVGQSYVITGNGASTYSWSGGGSASTKTVSPSATTTYTVIGTSSVGCTSTANSVVTVNPLPTITTSSATICVGETATITAGGANTYVWSSGSTTSSASISPTTSTTYTVTGTSSLGCIDTEKAVVKVNPLPTVSANSKTICEGQSTTLTASGASTYSWSSGGNASSETVSPSVTTTYTVIGTSTFGCTDSQGVIVTVNPLPTVTLNFTSSTVCTGTSVTLDAGGASSYSWSSGLGTGSTKSVSPSATTTYTVTGTSLGCTATAISAVTVNPLPTLSANSETICVGQSVTLTVDGATTYSWSDGLGSGSSKTVSPSSTTTYTVTGTSSEGCSSTTNAVVTVNPVFTITASAGSNGSISPAGTTTICNGGSQTYTITPNSGYLITSVIVDGNNVGTTATYSFNNVIANHTISASFANCIVAPAKPVISGPNFFCNTGVTATYSITPVSGASSYTWTIPAGTKLVNGSVLSGSNTSIDVYFTSNFTSGNITAVAINGCGTSTAASLAIKLGTTAYPAPIGGLTNICDYVGTSATVTYTVSPIAGVTSYNWTPPTGANIITGQGTNTVTVNFTSAFSNSYLYVQGINACGAGQQRGLAIAATKPTTPGTISGAASVGCYLGTSTAVTYSITPVVGVNKYKWIVPTGVTIVSPTDTTTSINVVYAANFKSGYIYVKSVANCGTSANRSYFVSNAACVAARANTIVEEEIKVENIFSSIYPNPTSNNFTIEVSTGEEKVLQVVVYDISGKILKQQQYVLSIGKTLMNMSLEEFNNGMYFIRITDTNANVVFSKTVMKQ